MKQARMIIAIILFGLIPLVLCIAKDKPVDPNQVIDPNVIIDQEALEVESMVSLLPVKEKELKEKEYTGTIDVILEQRIVDVNDFCGFAKDVNDKAKTVCEKLGLDVKKKDFIKAVLDRKIDEKEKQKNNNVIIKAVVEILNDPNSQPDIADPNYIDEIDRRRDFLAAIIEICSPK